ncbi:hypothetical protein C8Q77DRAFT_770899 [Trametes polyzona]|nr:hypothetical protein C8Q77DRAFT_770899 [Trametes polyzona]
MASVLEILSFVISIITCITLWDFVKPRVRACLPPGRFEAIERALAQTDGLIKRLENEGYIDTAGPHSPSQQFRNRLHELESRANTLGLDVQRWKLDWALRRLVSRAWYAKLLDLQRRCAHLHDDIQTLNVHLLGLPGAPPGHASASSTANGVEYGMSVVQPRTSSASNTPATAHDGSAIDPVQDNTRDDGASEASSDADFAETPTYAERKPLIDRGSSKNWGMSPERFATEMFIEILAMDRAARSSGVEKAARGGGTVTNRNTRSSGTGAGEGEQNGAQQAEREKGVDSEDEYWKNRPTIWKLPPWMSYRSRETFP